MREQEKSYGIISKKLKCTKSAAKCVINHWKTTGFIIALPRPRKQQKTSEWIDRLIRRSSEGDRKKTAVDICYDVNSLIDTPLSVHTVRRRLVENQLYGRVSRATPLISNSTSIKRLDFAYEHLNLNVYDWKNYLFSDKTNFNLKRRQCGQVVKVPGLGPKDTLQHIPLLGGPGKQF